MRLCVLLVASLSLLVPPVAGQEPQRRPAAAADVPESVELVRDVVYATAAHDDGTSVDLLMDAAFLKRSDGKPMPVVVYIHGGGYSRGSKEMGLPLILALARGGYFAVSINYRLAPASRFPAAVHDCKAAIRFLRANAERLAIDPQRIGVWGHSAGGHLSALLAVSGNSTKLEGPLEPAGVSSDVTCAVDLSGPSDLSLLIRTEGEARGILETWLAASDGAVSERATEASSVTYVDATDPPILIVHGETDRLVPIRQSEVLHEKLKAAGAPVDFLRVPDEGHLVAQPRAYRQIAEFFDKHLGGRAVGALEDAVRQLFTPP